MANSTLSVVEPSTGLARLLITSQFPTWAQLAVTPISSSGTANKLFSLGEEMVVRFPQTTSAILSLDKEHLWLPMLAQHLCLPIPMPLERGHRQSEYPWPWSIYSWLPGEDGWKQPIKDLNQAASSLAQFLTELESIDLVDGLQPGRHNSFRGEQLAGRDQGVRTAITELGDRVDRKVVTRAWNQALEQPLWEADRWIHGDLQPGNLLSQQGKISAVIDFGLLGIGDPACDLLPAWNLLTRQSRERFRSALQIDNETWIRGQGWALYQALLALPYYWKTNQVMVRMSQRVLNELFNDS